MPSIRPIQDRVLVTRTATDSKTPGGIFIPESAKEKLNQGRVLAVGPGKVLDSGVRVEPRVKVGDEVLFGQHQGHEFAFGVGTEKNLVMLHESDLFAVIEK